MNLKTGHWNPPNQRSIKIKKRDLWANINQVNLFIIGVSKEEMYDARWVLEISGRTHFKAYHCLTTMLYT